MQFSTVDLDKSSEHETRLSSCKKKKTPIFLYLSVQFSGTYLWDWAGQTNGHTSVYITAL